MQTNNDILLFLIVIILALTIVIAVLMWQVQRRRQLLERRREVIERENREAEALLREREQMYATIDAFSGTAKGAALAEALRLKCASLCCSIHTMPENRPDSLSGQHAAPDGTDKSEANAREIADLEGSDSEVVERYDETGAQALIETARIAAGAGNQVVAFRRGATLWQMALDDIMNPVYEAATEERKQAVAAWRVTLDSLQPAERDLLAMMYGENQAVTEEQLMDLYKDAVLNTEHVR